MRLFRSLTASGRPGASGPTPRPLLQVKRGKRKKRRKRKLPKAGCRLFPPSCGRPCDHASDSVHPQTLGFPVAAQRQVPTVNAFQLQVQFLDMAFDMPVVLRQVPGSRVQKTCLFRSCSSSTVVDIPFVPQRQIPMVQTVQQPMEFSQLPIVFERSMSLLCR